MFTNNYMAKKRSEFLGEYNKHAFRDWHGESRVVSLYNGSGNAIKWYDIGQFATGRCATVPAANKTAESVNPGVYFGSGSTPANKADNKLESLITSGLTIASPSAFTESNDGNGKYEFSASYVLTNTSGVEMNIYEVGFVLPIFNASSTYYHPTLVERTVLDEPVTIPAGGTKMVTYKITFNQTLNVE